MFQSTPLLLFLLAIVPHRHPHTQCHAKVQLVCEGCEFDPARDDEEYETYETITDEEEMRLLKAGEWGDKPWEGDDPFFSSSISEIDISDPDNFENIIRKRYVHFHHPTPAPLTPPDQTRNAPRPLQSSRALQARF